MDETEDLSNEDFALLRSALPIFMEAIGIQGNIPNDKPIEVYLRGRDLILDVPLGFIWLGEQLKAWFLDNVSPKMKYIPQELRKKPDSNIVGPALESLKYTSNIPELNEMFANLIASSMNIHGEAHPSFVEVINQMTPDEAKVMMYLASLRKTSDSSGFPVIRFSEQKKYEDTSTGMVGRSERILVDHYSKIWKLANFEHHRHDPHSLDNLVRLHLIKIVYGAWAYTPGSNKSAFSKADYEALEKEALQGVIQQGITPKQGYQFTAEEGVVVLTSYGKHFVKCCVETEETDLRSSMT